jgi:hypothetical protein
MHSPIHFTFFAIYSGPYSATIRFSLGIPRRVLPLPLLLLVPPRVKPSKYLFHRLLPYPASLRRWKCPSLLERTWTCPTETCRKAVGADGSFITRQGSEGETSRTMPALLFLCYFVIHSLRLDGVLYKPLVFLGQMASIDLCLWHQPCPSSPP